MNPGSNVIRNWLNTIYGVLRSKANQICISTCDGFVLQMHYKWTFYILLGGFFTVLNSWYCGVEVKCRSHHDASRSNIEGDYLNVCLSYPFVNDNGSRRYLLYYRWIKWALLILACVYYTPRKVSKNFDNVSCKRLLEKLTVGRQKNQDEKVLAQIAADYMSFNLKTHNGLYWKFLSVNVLSLVIDAFAIKYLDFLLQGRFIQYGIKAYPFERDPKNFTDYMSQTFPPFVSCELSLENQLVNTRTERFGCHLTIMELYEKFFLVLWVWLLLLSFTTCCYIVFLFTMWLPCVNTYLLRFAKPLHAKTNVRTIIDNVVKNYKIGDIYLLYRLKGHLSHTGFFELMSKLSDSSLQPKQILSTNPRDVMLSKKDKMTEVKCPQQQNNLRKRGSDVTQGQSVEPDFRKQLRSNTMMMNCHPQLHSQQQTLLKNTSILIE